MTYIYPHLYHHHHYYHHHYKLLAGRHVTGVGTDANYSFSWVCLGWKSLLLILEQYKDRIPKRWSDAAMVENMLAKKVKGVDLGT